MNNKWKLYIILLGLCVPLFFLNIRDTHPWGEDFSQYIKQAKNIAEGRPFYKSAYIFNDLNTDYAPPQYPPGYSLLLAPAVKFYGIAIKPMLYVNCILFSALLLVLVGYFRKYVAILYAVLLSLMIVYSNFLLDMKGNILSDVPCMLFTTMYLWLRNSKQITAGRRLLLILTALMAILMRTQAIVLLAAEGVVFLIEGFNTQKRGDQIKNLLSHPAITIIPLTLLCYGGLTATVFAVEKSTFWFYVSTVNNANGAWQTMGENINYLISILLECFRFQALDPFWQAPITMMGYFILSFSVLGFIISIRKNASIDHFFFLAICLLQVLFPPQQGPRYIVQGMPMYLLFAVLGLKEVLPLVLKIKLKTLAIVFSLGYFVLGYENYRTYASPKCDGCMPIAPDSTLFNYLREHVADSEIILCNKPRPIALFAERRTIVYAWQKSIEVNKHRFDSLGVTYILTGFDDNHYIENYIKVTNCAVDSQLIVDDFYLIRLRK